MSGQQSNPSSTPRSDGGTALPQALPPGQRRTGKWPVLHYGPVPRVGDPGSWQLWITGATESGREHVLDFVELDVLPRVSVTADLHCVNGFSLELSWSGWPTQALLELVPPHPDVTHAMVWAEYGYSANLPIGDLVADHTLLATHIDDEPLPTERGGPLRLVVPHRYAFKGPKWLRAIEYLTADKRGFWEERGYHNLADPWSDQRYSHQESTGDGPPL